MIVRNVDDVRPRPGLERVIARTVLGSIALPPRTFTDPTMSLTEYDLKPGMELTGLAGHAEREEVNHIIEGDGNYLPRGQKHQFLNDSRTPLHFLHLAARVTPAEKS